MDAKELENEIVNKFGWIVNESDEHNSIVTEHETLRRMLNEFADQHFKDKVKELNKCDVCNDSQGVRIICNDCIIDQCNDRI